MLNLINFTDFCKYILNLNFDAGNMFHHKLGQGHRKMKRRLKDSPGKQVIVSCFGYERGIHKQGWGEVYHFAKHMIV